MVKKETLEKIKEMLKELNWSDEVINNYFQNTFENESLAAETAKL